jgi:serine phosphatase RsbU (regulator of sigma subunit)
MRAHRALRTDEHVPLRRLLDREALEALVVAATADEPRGSLALIDLDGAAFVGGGEWLDRLASRLRRAVTGATVESVPVATGVRLYHLRARSGVVGGLVVRDPVAPSVVEVVRRSLTLLVGQSLDTRDLGQETLDRYREINLLYRLGETIGGSLDASKIPRLLLTEARRAIRVDAAAVLIGRDHEPRPVASQGTPKVVERLVEASRELIGQVMQTGQPRIVESLEVDVSALSAVLCVPIRSQEKTLGAVLLGRRRGGEAFNAGDEKLLLAIASEGGVAYDRALLHEQRVQRERLDHELSIGRRIQLSLLPASSPNPPGWEFAAIYRAARQVGGDFYDFIELPEAPGTIGLIIGDVTGKGVPAALLMASTRAVLRASSAGAPAPSVVLERTNRHILRDGRAGLFVTALYATLELTAGRLLFASGGHDAPLWVDGSARRSRLLTTRSSILGAFSEIDLEDRRIELRPGDLLVLYTDGVTEARDARGRLFGERRLRAVVTAYADGSAQAIADAVLNAVTDFAGEVPWSDDLTLLVVKRTAAGEAVNVDKVRGA